MSVVKKFVLLLKSQKDDENEDEYEVILKAEKYTVQQVKTIDFNYINLDKLKDKLLNSDDYSGIIFSSPRCVNAVKLSLETNNILNKWKSKDNYVVGEATYKTALSNLDLDCLGKETGNANILSQEILKKKEKYIKDFLYPHGNLKMDILKMKFDGTNLGLNEIMVYETITNKNIKKEFEQVTSIYSNLPEYIIFFSPSGVKALQEVLEHLPVKLVKIIAIGPTTESALLKAGLNVFGVAEKPTARDVLNILVNDI